MPQQNNDNVAIFLQAVRELLPFLNQQNDTRLTKRIGVDKLQDAADDLAGYIQSGVTGDLSKNEKLALSSQLLKCLVRNMQRMNIPLTLKTLIDGMGFLQHSVDESFPGYAESKLLKYIILPLTQSKESSDA